MIQKRLDAVALLSCVAMLSGCAPLLTSQVEVPTLDNAVSESTSLTDATTAANDLIIQLRKASAQHSHLRNGSAALLIPLTALGIYRGVTGNPPNGHNLAALGITGGTIYYAGGLYYSEARQRLFTDGAMAVQCAVNATMPYRVDAATLSGLSDGASGIDTDASVVYQSVAALRVAEAAHRAVLEPAWASQIAADVRRAQRLIDRAGRVRVQALVYVSNAANAGPALKIKARDLRLLIESEAQKKEPKFEQLALVKEGITKSIIPFGKESGTSGQPLDEPKGGSQQGANERAKQELQEKKNAAKRAIDQAIANLANHTASLAARTNSISQLLAANAGLRAPPKEAMDRCTVVPLVDEGLVISPDIAQYSLKPGESVTFVAVKPVGVSATLDSTGQEFLKLEAKAALSQFVVTYVAPQGVKAPRAGETAELTFADKDGRQEKSVRFDLGSADPAPTSTTMPGTTPTMQQPVAKTSEVLRCVQTAIGMVTEADGRDGPFTQGKLAAYGKDNNIASPKWDQSDMLVKAGCAKVARVDIDKAMRCVQAAIGAKVAGGFGPEMTGKLADYATKEGLADRPSLTDEVLDKTRCIG